MKLHLLFSALLIIFYCNNGRAEKMFFRNLTPENGLSHGDVICLFQDHEGYMWIGTVDGLNKYDGVSFTVYKYIQNDTTSLPQNCVIGIYEDKNNNLWIGTASATGLCRYNRDKDNFERIPLKDAKQNKLEFIITTFFEDNDHELWVCSSNGVYLFDTKNLIFHPCFTNEFGKDILVNFNEVHQDRNGILWFASEDQVNGGIIRYDSKTKSIDRYNNRHPVFKLKENAVYSLLIDKNDKIWIGGYTTGLSMIDERSKTIVNYQENPADKNGLNNNFIPTLEQNSDGEILIGTNGGGLNVFDPSTKIFKHYSTRESEGSLASNSIKNLYTSNDGMLWIACWGGGISIYDKRFQKFKKYTKDRFLGYSFSTVTCFAEDLNGNIWIGADGNGITGYNPEDGKFKRYLSDVSNPKTLTNNKVLSLETDNKGGLWAGMWAGGLNYFKIAGNNLVLIKKYPLVDEKDPKSNSVFRIYKNKAGEIWVGNFETGAYLYDPKTEKFKLMFSLKDTTRIIKANSAILDILTDFQGDVWFATLGTGLIRFNPNTGEHTIYHHDEKDSTSIISDGANVLFEDSENRLWIGSSGLSLFDRDNNKFVNFTTSQGLPDNSVVGILEDDHHNLWLSSHNGMTKATLTMQNNKFRLSCRNYSTQDGLQDKVFNQWAFLKSRNGSMYFGGVEGFNVFYPDSIKDNPFLPQVHITDFLLFNRPVIVGAKKSPLTRHISQTHEFTLNYDQSVMTFRFIALNYIHSEKNQYAYKMEGFEENWNYVGNKREATYTNLNPGQYVFRVRASNNDGIWNEEGTSIKITILPPWWKTWWFRILALSGIILLIFSYINYRIHGLKKQKILLTKLVNERTQKLEKANAVLEEIKEEVIHQNEELQVQKENLREVNTELEEKQEEIFRQNEELQAQKETLQEINRTLEEQKEEIETQRNELDQHRNHLEQLVKERTEELLIALKKAEESDRLKSAFLQNMSHEIRTPMNAIVGFSDLLADPDISIKEKDMFNTLIRKSSETLLALINDILDMSQIQANELITQKVPFEVAEIMKELFSTFQMTAQSKGISLILDAGTLDDNIHCLADPVRFRQIFSNLIINALKFTEKGFVKFGASIQTNGLITFYVRDTGIGIPKEIGNSIYERFLKVESTKTKLYRGVGLGLSICYNLVKAMSGNIWYESELGQGTTFFFTLPGSKTEQLKTAVSEPKQSSSIAPDLSDKQILIVEDEETNYLLLSFFLAKTKAKLFWAKNGREALEMTKINYFDLILMDVKMPTLDGIEATRIIKQIKPDQVIVAQTAFAFKEEKDEFMKCGFNNYIEKPIILEELMRVINDTFTMHKQR